MPSLRSSLWSLFAVTTFAATGCAVTADGSGPEGLEPAEEIASSEEALARADRIGEGEPDLDEVDPEPGDSTPGDSTPGAPIPTFPPIRPRPRTCPTVHPSCGREPATFLESHAFERALKVLGCKAPFHYFSGEPHDYPFSKGALCPDTVPVRALVRANASGPIFQRAVFTRVACDKCLAAPPPRWGYVIFRRVDVLGPLCPSNCVDTPWDETQAAY